MLCATLNPLIKAVVGDGALTAEVAGRLKYLDAVCRETLRLMPPTGGGFRIMETTEKVMGYTFPKVSMTLHHTPSLPTATAHPCPRCPVPNLLDPPLSVGFCDADGALTCRTCIARCRGGWCQWTPGSPR